MKWGFGTNLHFHKVISDSLPRPGILSADISLDKTLIELMRNNKGSFRSNCLPRKLKVDSYVRLVGKENEDHL